MADERPPNSVQFVVDYFVTGILNKALGVLALRQEIKFHYTNLGLVSYLNIIFSLPVD